MNRVRGNSLKWLCLILPLILSLTIANVASTSSTVIFVDPPQKLVWWDPPSFSVDMNVSDVTDLHSWGANMTWDPTIINATAVTEGAFLKGPFLWDTHPYHHATQPYWDQTKTPGSSVTIVAGWTGEGVPPPTLVQAVSVIDRKFASSSTDGAEVEWGDFGLITGNMSVVAELKVGVYASTTESNITEQDKIEIKVSNDGGSGWGSTHTVDVFESEMYQWVDVTGDFSWTPSMLTDANFKVRMAYKQAGVATTTIKVNYLPVKVVDTLVVEDPGSAHDQVAGSYASFRYSDTRGNFTVYDFGHDFPSGVTDPTEETSTIVQVDFNMRYEAAASTLGDKYKIVYYVDPSSTETVLEDWKSAATPLNDYTWANQSEPNGLGWDWTDISKTRIVVEINKTGGDTNAVFNEYEAWLTVTYLRPTSMYVAKDSTAGWIYINVYTQGKYPGVDGSGTLVTVAFDILDYGETNLTLTDTVLMDSTIPPDPITHTAEDGYVRISLPGDMTDDDPDVPPSPPDGDVDRYDLGEFADAFGSSEGDPEYNPLADLTDDTPDTPPSDPDGDVDRYDLGIFADNFGTSV